MSKIAGVLKDFYAAHQQKVFQAEAPGRLDVMGGVADYAGSLLLQKVLPQETTVYLAFREDLNIQIRSIYQGETRSFFANYSQLVGNFNPVNYDYSRQQILAREGGDWAVHLVGCLLVFFHEKKIKPEGVDMVITSEVPMGKGVASSAAVEVALLKALKDAYSLTMGEYEIPILAQQAENRVVGAPCGLMDQLATYVGKPGKLIPMICQPSEVYHFIDIPDAIRLAGIDSGVRHDISGEAYVEARTAAFMGYSIIALAAGAAIRDLEIAKETMQWSRLPYRGYLANISPSEFEDKYLPMLPETISGEAFIEKYKAIIDPLSFIDRDKTYRLLACTRHPVYENFRVMLFAQIIKNYTTEFQDYSNRLSLMGELMYQSHQSYTDCGLGHERTDELVTMVKATGNKKGLYGARVTGGGSGGTVCVLCSGLHGPDAAAQIHADYGRKYGMETAFFMD